MQEEYLADTSPWIEADLNLWTELIKNLTPVFYPKKSFLFHQADDSNGIFVVKSGRVRITSHQLDGAEKQVYIAEKGCMIGETACFTKYLRMTAAIAIVDSYVYHINRDIFVETLKSNWELTQEVIEFIGRKNAVYLNQTLELSFLQSIQRVASMLYNLCNQYGKETKEGYKIDIPFTHQDIASMVNASRVTVSNVITMLSEEKIIKKVESRCIILDIDSLKDLISGTSPLLK